MVEDEDEATTIVERTMLMLMIVMMAIMDQWFLWMWRMPISKHRCPPLLCTIDLSNAVKQTTVNIGGHQLKRKHHTTCCSKCGLTGGGGMHKIVGIIGKFFCQTHTFAFIICLALSKQDEMCKKKNLYGKLLLSGLDPGTCQPTSAVWILGA